MPKNARNNDGNRASPPKNRTHRGIPQIQKYVKRQGNSKRKRIPGRSHFLTKPLLILML
jgi:hypothetical protein